MNTSQKHYDSANLDFSDLFTAWYGSPTDYDFSDLFTETLTYEAPAPANAPTNTTVTPEYGGNISQMTWQTRGREKQSYTFKYDYINRMTEADYADISNAGAITNDRYTEKLTYDIRGNIQSLQRYGYNSNSCSWGLIDNLSYNYGAYGYNPFNKVNSISETSDATRGFVTQSNGSAYSYDVDGNMTADPNKGITSIVYNHLNLPTQINFTNNRVINFLYDAGGNKLRKTVVNDGTTLYTQDYVNGIEYKNNVLEAIYHSEGRVTNIDGSLKYEYAMKDHLGNTRLMFCDRNGDGVIKPENAPEPSEVTQENSYYAFGMNMEFGAWENTPSVTDNLYLYNNKELNTDFGLNWEHNDWRFYDPTVGRFWSIDKEAEKPNQVDYTPYHFGFNNPIKNSDPTGLEGEACCGDIGAGLKGVAVGFVDNLLGTSFRESAGNSYTGSAKAAYDNGVLTSDVGSLLSGIYLTGAGEAGLGGAALATVSSGGTSSPVTVPMAAGSGLAIVTGSILIKNSAANLGNSIAKAEDGTKSHETYTKPPLDPSKDAAYSGRTSGTGTPDENVAARDKNHHMNNTHGPAKLDNSSKNPAAIRGREQQLIDKNGGAKSTGGTSGNAINGIGPKNKKGDGYKEAAKKEFGGN